MMRKSLISYFFLSLFLNISLVLAQGILISSASGQAYSQVFFGSTLALVSLFFLLTYCTKKQSLGVHFSLSALAGIALVLLCFPAVRVDYVALYFLCGLLLVLDGIAPSILSNIDADRLSPGQFVSFSGKLVAVQAAARGIASGLLILSGKFDLLFWVGGIGFVSIFAHLFCLKVFGDAGENAGVLRSEPEPSLSKGAFGRAFRFLWLNPLVRTAMIATVWNAALKFLVDLALLQGTAQFSQGINQSASVLGQINFIHIACILFFNRFVGRRWIASRPLSQVLALMPATIFTLALVIYMYRDFYLIVLMTVAHQAIGRSVQNPVLRQLFLFAPIELRKNIFQVSMIQICVFSAILSGGIGFLKNSSSLGLTVILICGVCLRQFFLVAKIDTFHLRNLWRHYKQNISGFWSESDPAHVTQIFSMQGPVIEVENPEHEADKFLGPKIDDANVERSALYLQEKLFRPGLSAAQKKSTLIYGLEKCHSPALLKICSRALADLMGNENKEERRTGLEVAFASGLPFLRGFLLRTELGPAETAYGSLALGGLAAPTRRKVRYVLLDANRQGALDFSSAKLHWALLNLPMKNSSAFIDVLFKPDFSELREKIWACLDGEEEGRISLLPLVNEVLSAPEGKFQKIALVLDRLNSRYGRGRMANFLYNSLEPLVGGKQSFWSTPDEPMRRRILRLLFLEQWFLDKRGVQGYLRDTIREYSFSPDSASIFTEMHLEALKASPRLAIWNYLLQKRVGEDMHAKAALQLRKRKV